ncbi:MAG TPA: MFS transporter [Planctomycetota bacterium]|jgi:ACS family tartrate transporter-like MFS transporter|nr:MFS transporter [Planctomycetota bacterium]
MSGALAPPIDPARIRKKIAWRILPFVFLLYMIAYLDRANVAFVKLSMTADLRFSEGVFGLGAGIFFIGYLALEIPGALLVERKSARKWFSRILVSWGFCTMLGAFVRTPVQFYATRFLLGVAEAGFFPGLIVYFTHWFTGRERARALSVMIMAIPVGLTLAGPLSGLILRLGWLGMAGWRWVFILEGLPAIALGIATIFYLTDRPKDATWLEPQERAWISAELEKESELKKSVGSLSVGQALRHRNVWLLALALSAANAGSQGFNFWLPTTIGNASDLTPSGASMWTTLPYALSIGVMYLSGRSSDHKRERRMHAGTGMACTAVFLGLSVIPGQSFAMVMFWLCLTAAANSFWPSPFWVLPTVSLTASAAAAAVGLINSIGNLGGFFGPAIFGGLRTTGLSHNASLIFLASCYLLAAALVLAVRVRPETDPPETIRRSGPEGQETEIPPPP